MKVRLPFLFVLAALLAGCGYVLNGEWRDDPKNWKRAFGVSTPAGLFVYHSLYSRAPHFTNEWCYYFELEDSKVAREAIGIYANWKPSEKKASELSLGAGRPPWFLKEVPADAVVLEHPGAEEFIAVIDQERGRIFLHNKQ